MSKFELTKKEKGEEGEINFKKWLDKHNLSYLYIDQKFDNFSPNFKDTYKRPDFFILIPHFGTIIIDVKNQGFSDKSTFTISKEEVDKYLNLQLSFNLPLWFVVSNNTLNFETWYWISTKKVQKNGNKINKKDGNSFYSINLSEFTQVASDESLEKVFKSALNSK